MIFTIAQRELRTLFLSPIAWLVMVVSQFILAYLFLIHLQEYLQLQPQLATLDNPPGVSEFLIARLYLPAASLYLLMMPLLSMRLLAGELNSGSLDLLLSAPLSVSEIVFGKYLGLLGMLTTLLLLNTVMPLTLLWVAPIDLGALASALLGSWLLLASMAAMGLYLSSLTSQPLVAAFSSFGLLLFLWVINAGAQGESAALLNYIALPSHLGSFFSGQLDSSDLGYYLLLCGGFLTLTIRRLDNLRLQH